MSNRNSSSENKIKQLQQHINTLEEQILFLIERSNEFLNRFENIRDDYERLNQENRRLEEENFELRGSIDSLRRQLNSNRSETSSTSGNNRSVSSFQVGPGIANNVSNFFSNTQSVYSVGPELTLSQLQSPSSTPLASPRGLNVSYSSNPNSTNIINSRIRTN